MSGARFAIFLTLVLSIWAVMHAYVFWRLGSLPWIQAHIPRKWFISLAVLLWAIYPLARMLDSWGLHRVAQPLELVAGNWVGTLFLLFAFILVLDVLTAGGTIISPENGEKWRGAVALTALGLAIVAMIIGSLPPVVRQYTVYLPGFPPERNGLRLVAISDLHLGSVLREKWASDIVKRVNALEPDLLVVVGDVVDGDADRAMPLAGVLREFQAPLGVYAVSGNHEYYAGLEDSFAMMEKAGFKVLRDTHAEVFPGLIMAGVDDLTAREQMNGGDPEQALRSALQNMPPGARILLSHTPSKTGVARELGVGLMLSGHTHNGQIWPFNYLVKLRYPHIHGRYELGGMTLITGAGTGTWGPRMRLWGRAEILSITLQAAPPRELITPPAS